MRAKSLTANLQFQKHPITDYLSCKLVSSLPVPLICFRFFSFPWLSSLVVTGSSAATLAFATKRQLHDKLLLFSHSPCGCALKLRCCNPMADHVI